MGIKISTGFEQIVWISRYTFILYDTCTISSGFVEHFLENKGFQNIL